MSIFYQNRISEGIYSLSKDESKHCSLVLRYKKGDEIIVFDGNGGKHRSILTQVTEKICEFEIIESIQTPAKKFKIHLGIAPTKNTDRIEWLVEKLTEIGIDEMTLLETDHNERRNLRMDRLTKKTISAMKQSGNPFLLKINPLTQLNDFINKNLGNEKFIAHLDKSHTYLADVIKPEKNISILIGPEGDFSRDELAFATQHGYQPVSLGGNVLRTETAGLISCCMVNFINKF